MMKVLLVEDDEYKAADLIRMLENRLDRLAISRAASVTSALRALTSEDFNLVILDMSLPTFDLSGPGGGGSPQGQGGIEFLRVASRGERRTRYIVVTQYPDIEIDGTNVPLGLASVRLSKRFRLDVLACLPYEFDRDDWELAFTQALSRVVNQ